MLYHEEFATTHLSMKLLHPCFKSLAIIIPHFNLVDPPMFLKLNFHIYIMHNNLKLNNTKISALFSIHISFLPRVF